MNTFSEWTELPLSESGALEPPNAEPVRLLPEDEIEARRLWVWLTLEAADDLIREYDAEQAEPVA